MHDVYFKVHVCRLDSTYVTYTGTDTAKLHKGLMSRYTQIVDETTGLGEDTHAICKCTCPYTMIIVINKRIIMLS